jgi:small-conductance mechanosensitive channel
MLASSLVLVAALAALAAARGRSRRLMLWLDAASLAALTLALWRDGVNPLLLSKAPGPPLVHLGRAVVTIGWWLFACRVAVWSLKAVLGRDARSREMRLFSDLVGAGVYIAAAAIVLGVIFKLPIGGLVATSGVVAVVLGLALQNTLADVFAGIAVGVEQPFRVGDRVRLSDGTEGRVEQMNWRSVRLRTDQDDLAVIPNSTIAKAEIINRSTPSEGGVVRAEITADAAASPDRVFELMRAAVMLTSDALAEPAPTTLLMRVGQRTSAYAVTFHVADTGHASRARSDFLRYMRRQLATDGLTPGTAAGCGGRLLREATLFESLDEDQLSQLRAALKLRRVLAGEALFEQGATEPLLYLIASGVVQLTRSIEGGRTEVLGRIGAGEYIGEMSLLTGSPRMVTTTALTDAQVYSLDKAALHPLFEGNDELVQAFERSVRRGRLILARNPAIAQAEELSAPGELLGRIVHFFRRSAPG